MVLPFNPFHREFEGTLRASALAFEPVFGVYFPPVILDNLTIQLPFIVL
jgi:hypothetical protein